MSLRAMNIAAANTVSHSARSSKAASYALIEAVRFLRTAFLLLLLRLGRSFSRTGRIWQSGYGIIAAFKLSSSGSLVGKPLFSLL